MTAPGGSEAVEVRTERMATGGEAVGRLDDGRVVFVRGALEGETVRIAIDEERKRFARGHVTRVVDESPDRRPASCRHAHSGECGGCDWIHVSPAAQRSYKRRIVEEQLQRLGGIEDPVVDHVEHEAGSRTTVRAAVVEGRAGYRARRTNDAFSAEECGAAHPLIEELLVEGDFGDASQVTVRVATATGQRLVLTDGTVASVGLPADVQVVAADDPGDAAIVEHLAGRPWRISARSFFQTSSTGAAALVETVARHAGAGSGSVVDLYAGVGLLGGAATPNRLECAVESNGWSAGDARHNLGAGVTVVQHRVDRWTPKPFDTVIADPARRGLAADGVRIVAGTGAQRLVLVSCDPASLGRDTALLVEQGWCHEGSDLIDMFPDTSRIEVVSGFTRSTG